MQVQPLHPPPQQSLPPQPETMQQQQQPQQPQQQQPQVIVLQSGGRSSYKASYAALTSRVLGVIQIVGGVLAIVFQAILTGLQSQTQYSGAGFWCGIMFILAGSFGLSAGKYKSRGLIITYMVLAIITAVLTIGIFGGTSAGFAIDKDEFRYTHKQDNDYNNDYRYYDRYNDYGMENPDEDRSSNSTDVTTANPYEGTPSPPRVYNSGRSDDNTEWNNFARSALAFNCLLVIVGFVEMVTLIWGSTLGCKVMCCCQDQQHMAIPVQYANGQTFIAMGTNQMQGVPQMAYMPPNGMPYTGYNLVYPAGPAAQPVEEKLPVPDSPPPGYA